MGPSRYGRLAPVHERRARFPHRVRQRRKPHARARSGATPRNGRPHRARRDATTPGRSDPHGDELRLSGRFRRGGRRSPGSWSSFLPRPSSNGESLSSSTLQLDFVAFGVASAGLPRRGTYLRRRTRARDRIRRAADRAARERRAHRHEPLPAQGAERAGRDSGRARAGAARRKRSRARRRSRSSRRRHSASTPRTSRRRR